VESKVQGEFDAVIELSGSFAWPNSPMGKCLWRIL